MDDGPRSIEQIMENTQNSLDAMIQQWRARLAESPAFKNENVDELEEHLRDSMAALQLKGLSEEEAFLIASRRIGSSENLGREFGKMNGKRIWMSRVLWMLVGVQISYLVIGIANNLVQTGVMFGVYQFGRTYGFNLDHASLVCGVVAGPVAFVFLLWLCWHLLMRSQAINGWFERRFRSRSKFLAGCLLLTVVWAARFVIAVPVQLLALRNMPYLNFYQRFDAFGILRMVSFWMEPLCLLVLTFVVASKVMRQSKPASIVLKKVG